MSGLTKVKYYPSEELAVIIGTSSPISRPQVVKKLWIYIKKHDLQNPTDKRMIVPDDDLSDVLGTRPINMLKMQAKLTPHLERAD